jgi:imidazole glycerol phosphate synthase subunit HisF
LKVADEIEIPVSVSGGIPSISAAANLIKNTKIDSVGGTTMFVFDPKTNSVFLSYPRHEEWNQVLTETL